MHLAKAERYKEAAQKKKINDSNEIEEVKETEKNFGLETEMIWKMRKTLNIIRNYYFLKLKYYQS